ncbi:hypothetical protein HI914_03673 [Erysiphe necator]|nr:hypothetical protein HI914_03673 [Erysiphe necator]
MNALESFETLRFPDGRPDIVRRRLYLNKLISRLMPSEIRYLKVHLERINLSRTGNDIFKEMPNEICLKIIDYLYLEDLLRIRLVCHLWHQKFGHLDFSLHILKRYFDMPMEFYFKRSSFNSTEVEDTQKSANWIQRFIINRIRREHGITCRRYLIDGLVVDSIRYCSSRIAFQNGEIIEVRDLISKASKTFMTPTREQMKKWLLSDKYLIGIVHNPTKLLAWDMESLIANTIRLPAEVLSISASQNRVGIVTSTSEFFIWIVGGALRKLPKYKHVKDSQEEKVLAANIFFHCEDQDNVFLVSYSRIKSDSFSDEKYVTKITVQNFVMGIPFLTQHKILYTSTKPLEYRSTLISNGNLIGIEILDSTSKNFYEHFTYDMNKKQFNCQEVALHPMIRNALHRRNHIIWRDQIFLPIFIGEVASVQAITISKSLIEIWNEPPNSNYKSSLSLVQSSALLGENRSNSTCVTLDAEFFLRYSNGIQIWADDSFIIIYDKRKIQVWQFNDEGLEPCHSVVTDNISS